MKTVPMLVQSQRGDALSASLHSAAVQQVRSVLVMGWECCHKGRLHTRGRGAERREGAETGVARLGWRQNSRKGVRA